MLFAYETELCLHIKCVKPNVTRACIAPLMCTRYLHHIGFYMSTYVLNTKPFLLVVESKVLNFHGDCNPTRNRKAAEHILTIDCIQHDHVLVSALFWCYFLLLKLNKPNEETMENKIKEKKKINKKQKMLLFHQICLQPESHGLFQHIAFQLSHSHTSTIWQFNIFSPSRKSVIPREIFGWTTTYIHMLASMCVHWCVRDFWQRTWYMRSWSTVWLNN